MTWTKYKDYLHPTEVSWLLQQMTDVPRGTPILIQTNMPWPCPGPQPPPLAG